MDAVNLGEMFKARAESRRIGYNDALHSPAVTALLEAAKQAIQSVRDAASHGSEDLDERIHALEAAVEAVRKERGE